MLNTDNVQIILDHFLPEELKHLECELDEEQTIPTDLEEAIEFIEVIERTDHIAYNLLLLKNEIS